MPQHRRDLPLIDAELDAVNSLDLRAPAVTETLLEAHDADRFFVLEFSEEILNVGIVKVPPTWWYGGKLNILKA